MDLRAKVEEYREKRRDEIARASYVTTEHIPDKAFVNPIVKDSNSSIGFELPKREPYPMEVLYDLFSKKEAEDIMKTFKRANGAETSDTYNLSLLSNEAKEFLTNEMDGKRIIEVGDRAGVENQLSQFKILDYRGIDPYTDLDGLTYLSVQPENSAIVISFGVLEDAALYSLQGFNEPAHLKEYQRELGKQIYRVTPRGGITLHGLMYYHDLVKAGFEDIPSLPTDFLRERAGGRKLAVFRKAE